MSVKNNFGRLLKSLRTKSVTAWTQVSMAEELGISRRTYVGWENGENIPSPEYLKQIVTLFKLNKEDEDALYCAAAQMPPRVHNIPFLQNPFFTGREAPLKRLKQFLEENGTVAVTQPVSISGLGGIGKTQLALEYAHKSYPDMYRAVFWVDAAEESTLQAGYDYLAHMLELPERNEQKLDRRIQAVKRWMEGHTNWLLILDNADNLQLARSFLPVKHHGHVLLTTRSQIVGTIARQIEIEKMEPAEGLLFLLKRAGIVQHEANIATLAADVRDAAIELVTLLGGHPLALDQAGAYVEETGVSFADYLQLYQDTRRFLLDRRGSEESEYGDHPDSVAATIELSVRKAYEQQPMAADILHFCSFLQPDAIPEEVLEQDAGLQIDTQSLNEVIVALRRYSLIKRNTQEKTLSMHRLVQAVLIDTMSPALRVQWRERIILTLNKVFPEVKFKEWSRCRRLLPHALIAATWTETELTSMLDTPKLFLKAGIYLRERGQYAEAEQLMMRTLSIREQQLEGEPLDTAVSLHNLAVLYRRQGKYEQAETLYLQALSIYEQRLGPEHPGTASVLNDLAALYVRLGKYMQAENLYQRVLTVREQHLGAEHLDTVLSLHNLAELYRRQGKYEQAELLYQRVLSIRKKLLGDEHPEIASVLHELARLYDDQGKYEQAEAQFQFALNIQESHLGPDHPDTALSLYNLAALYWRQGKYEQAEPLCQRALMIRENQLGAEHPDTARSLNGMAILRQQQGKYEQAEVLWLRALAIFEQQPGTEGFYAAYPLHGLARLLQDQGEHEQAEALYQRALNIQDQQLRPTRLYSKATRNDYALFLRRIGRHAEATAVESSQN